MKVFLKVLKGILIAIASILVIVLICGIVMLCMIKDKTNDTNPQVIENNIALEDAIYTQVEEGISQTGDTGVVELDIDEYDLNEILYGLSKKIGDLGSIKVVSMYAKNNDGIYTIFVPTTVMGVNTCVKGNLTIEEKDGTFILTIKSLSLGNAKFDSGFINFGINLFKVKKQIVDKLNEMYIDASFDNDKITAQITRENLGKLLASQLNNNETGDLICALYNVFLIETDAVVFDINNPFSMKATINLNVFNGTKDTSLNTANTFTKEYLDSHDYNAKNSSLVTKFYITGYEHLSKEEKANIKTILEGTWTKEEITTYPGLIERGTATFKTILETQSPSFGTLSRPGFKITETDFNDIMSQMNFVGFSMGFSSYKTNETGFVCVEAFETQIQNDYVDLYLDFNVNGYKIRIHAGLNSPKSDGVKIVASLDKMDIGSVNLSEESKDLIFAYLCKVLNEDWIKANYETKEITFDFTEIFNTSPILKLVIDKANHLTTEFVRDSKGYLNISVL